MTGLTCTEHHACVVQSNHDICFLSALRPVYRHLQNREVYCSQNVDRDVRSYVMVAECESALLTFCRPSVVCRKCPAGWSGPPRHQYQLVPPRQQIVCSRPDARRRRRGRRSEIGLYVRYDAVQPTLVYCRWVECWLSAALARLSRAVPNDWRSNVYDTLIENQCVGFCFNWRRRTRVSCRLSFVLALYRFDSSDPLCLHSVIHYFAIFRYIKIMHVMLLEVDCLVCYKRLKQSTHHLGRFSAITALPIRMRLGRYRNLYWHWH